ncbi:MAG: CBS domain-containing protein [Proteobacteria bacterium]|nr:CBS domain-containing protein [Pseudomonadota bacterium]MBU1715417.1 CBS domain-containing protein [Pseudomonadota bacterium]
MFVTNFMTEPVHTVGPEASLSQVKELFGQRKFRHLPIVDQSGRLIGMLTDRDLRSAYPSGLMDENEKKAYLKRFKEMKVSQIMTETVAKLTPKSTLDDALLLFDRSRVGALPVVDDQQKVVGIFSIRDLLAAYKQLFGLGEKGSALIVVQDDGKPRPLTRLTEALENRNVLFSQLIRDVLSRPDNGLGLIYVRVHTHNLSGVHAALAAAGFYAVTPEAS